jgi:hypothetical protein
MSAFHVTWPVWVVTTEDSIERDEHGKPVRLKIPIDLATYQKDDIHALRAFTDDDLADRYVQSRNDPRLVAVTPNTGAEFVSLLRTFAKRGVNSVVFDLTPGAVGRFFPLDEVIADIEEQST